jgi:hypothetical protein
MPSINQSMPLNSEELAAYRNFQANAKIREESWKRLEKVFQNPIAYEKYLEEHGDKILQILDKSLAASKAIEKLRDSGVPIDLTLQARNDHIVSHMQNIGSMVEKTMGPSTQLSKKQIAVAAATTLTALLILGGGWYLYGSPFRNTNTENTSDPEFQILKPPHDDRSSTNSTLVNFSDIIPSQKTVLATSAMLLIGGFGVAAYRNRGSLFDGAKAIGYLPSIYTYISDKIPFEIIKLADKTQWQQQITQLSAEILQLSTDKTQLTANLGAVQAQLDPHLQDIKWREENPIAALARQTVEFGVYPAKRALGLV